MNTSFRLSIGILVGTEAEWLRSCLSGLAFFEGPIIVVGSADHPGVRAVCDAARVNFYLRKPEGEFSFSEQRNCLFEYCITPWILMLDVDERIQKNALNLAVRMSGSPPGRAYCVRHPYQCDLGLYLVDYQPRLLPGDGSMTFEGYVQNTLIAEHQNPEQIYLANFEIEDWGALLTPDRFTQRQRRYRRLSRLELHRLSKLAASESPEVLAQLGFRYFCMGLMDQSEAVLKRLIRMQPGFQSAEFYLARISAERDPAGIDAATKILWRLLEKGCSHYRIYQYLAKFHSRKEEWGAALLASKKGVDTHPECAAMHHYNAVALYRNGDTAAAGKSVKRCLELFPEYKPARAISRLLGLEVCPSRAVDKIQPVVQHQHLNKLQSC